MVSRIKELCLKNGTSVKALERELGLGNGTIRRWDSSSPSYDKLEKVAAALNTTVAYLCSDGSESSERPSVDGIPLNDKELEWLRRFQQAAPEVKDAALALLRAAEEAMKTIENIKEESANAVKDLADSYANHDERP